MSWRNIFNVLTTAKQMRGTNESNTTSDIVQSHDNHGYDEIPYTCSNPLITAIR